MSSGDASGIVQYNLRILVTVTVSGCSPLRMDMDSQERCAASDIFCFDLVMRQLLLQERVMSVFGRI